MPTLKRSLLLLFIAVVFYDCNKGSEIEARDLIRKFYSSATMMRDVDRSMLSADLSSMVTRAREFERRDADRIRASHTPSDKPHMIEGDIFTSLYEGQDGFRIKEIKVNDANAWALVEFSNSAYSQKWDDEVILMFEKGWKIDNVIFYEGRNGTSTKDVLKAFLQLEKAE